MPVVVKASFHVPADPTTQATASSPPGTIERSVTTAIGDRLVPDFQVKINGNALGPGLWAQLNWIEIRQSSRLVDMAILNFENHGGRAADAAEFKKGNEIVIEVGYVGEISWAFKGEIISLEPDFPVAGNPSVLVRAYDRLHRYRRGRKQRTFLNQKVSEVVTSLASEEGLSPDVEDTKIKHEYLLQNNQTNIDFIHELARRVGYEVEITEEAAKLFFKKPRYDQAKVLTLTWGENLKSFNVRKSVSNVPTEVSARYWNMKDKAAVTEKQNALHGALEPTDPAPTEAKKAFGDSKTFITLRPNTAPDEAKALAWSIFNEQALNSVKGKGTCLGEPGILPGVILELLGLGKTWSGLYYVTGAIHVLHRAAGYSTQFEVRRTGTGYAVEMDVVPEPTAPTREVTAVNRMDATIERAPTQAPAPVEEVPPDTKNLRLKFMDEDGEPFVQKPFELVIVGSDTINGMTDGGGRVVADVPADADSGEVTIWMDDDKSGDCYEWPIKISDHT